MSNKTKISALPYFGGKSARSATKLGAWINSLLPENNDDTVYIEPFAGMCGVLLQRPPAKIEIINDLNERVWNWWRVVRDKPDELQYYLDNSPDASRREYSFCVKNLDNKDPVKRAYALTVVLSLSRIPGDNNPPDTGMRNPIFGGGSSLHKRLKPLTQRMRYVRLECRDAIEVLESIVELDNAIIYADPPYINARKECYTHQDLDYKKLGKVFKEQEGKVAISGYGEEWDYLGWERHEYNTKSTVKFVEDEDTGKKRGLRRTEVLWTNYTPPKQRQLGLLDNKEYKVEKSDGYKKVGNLNKGWKHQTKTKKLNRKKGIRLGK